MYRIQEKYLSEWLKSKLRKPLVIRGARQVGKSTLVRQFCSNNKINLYEINLEKHPELNEIFLSKNINKIIEGLEDILEKKIIKNANSLLFLDELQATPEVIPALRYFYEELPLLPVIGTGSLLEFVLNDHKYAMPVGRISFLHMGPMSFYEFLLAKNESYFLDKITNFSIEAPFTAVLHEKGIQLLREFLFVGGMPEAINTYIQNDISAVPEVHANIIYTYQSDFVKYAKKSHLNKIQKVFRYIFLNPCTKIKYSNISRDDLSRDLKYNLELLIQARVINPVIHASCSGLPLESGEKESVFKLLALDIGLVNFIHGLKWAAFKKYTEENIVTEGVIAEQFVGQHLLFQEPAYKEPKLNYWLREEKSHNAEVDFIVELNTFLVAIEVKSGAVGKIRSLHQWMKDANYSKKKAVRFNLTPGSREKVSHNINNKEIKYELITLPLYLIDFWKNLIT